MSTYPGQLTLDTIQPVFHNRVYSLDPFHLIANLFRGIPFTLNILKIEWIDLFHSESKELNFTLILAIEMQLYQTYLVQFIVFLISVRDIYHCLFHSSYEWINT